MTPKTTTRLSGTICLPKGHFSEELWLLEPFSRGAACLDLWGLANDRRRRLNIRGVPLLVERGQLAWSIGRLAERWRWCRAKVNAFLVELQDERKIILLKKSNVTTVITVIDFTVYNPDTTPELPMKLTAEQAAECEAECIAEYDPEQTAESQAHRIAECNQKIGRSEEGRSEEGRGEGGPRPGTLVPIDEEVSTFCQSWPGDLARGIPGSIPEIWWMGWLASRMSSTAAFPRDWKRVLVLAFAADWLNHHAKARGMQKKNGGAANGTLPGDAACWWTDSLGEVESALAGALTGGNEKMAGRLREILELRKQ